MFFDRFQLLCQKSGTTPTRVIKDLGLSSSKVTAWKNGSSPNSEITKKIANYFNVSIDYLLENTDIPTPPSLDEQLDGIEFALFGEIKDLTDEQKQEILDYVRFKQQQNEQKNSH